MAHLPRLLHTMEDLLDSNHYGKSSWMLANNKVVMHTNSSYCYKIPTKFLYKCVAMSVSVRFNLEKRGDVDIVHAVESASLVFCALGGLGGGAAIFYDCLACLLSGGRLSLYFLDALCALIFPAAFCYLYFGHPGRSGHQVFWTPSISTELPGLGIMVIYHCHLSLYVIMTITVYHHGDIIRNF